MSDLTSTCTSPKKTPSIRAQPGSCRPIGELLQSKPSVPRVKLTVSKSTHKPKRLERSDSFIVNDVADIPFRNKRSRVVLDDSDDDSSHRKRNVMHDDEAEEANDSESTTDADEEPAGVSLSESSDSSSEHSSDPDFMLSDDEGSDADENKSGGLSDIESEKSFAKADDSGSDDLPAVKIGTSKKDTNTKPKAVATVPFTRGCMSGVVADSSKYEALCMKDFTEFKLIVDNRENPAHLEALKLQMAEEEVVVEHRTLGLKDYMILAIHPETRVEYVVAVIELKDTMDMLSSIKSSRFHEQKMRGKDMQLSYMHYVVVIRDEKLRYLSTSDIKRIYTATVNTHGIMLMQMVDLGRIIAGILHAIKNNAKKNPFNPENPDTVNALRFEDFQLMFSKKQITNAEQLLSITINANAGVNPTVAAKVGSRFKSLRNLVHQYEATPPKERANMLSTMFPGDIGKKISADIHRRIME